MKRLDQLCDIGDQKSSYKQTCEGECMSERYFDGSRAQRKALRQALQTLHAREESDQRICDLLGRYIAAGRVPSFPADTTAVLSRPTIQRIRVADDKTLAGIRPPTMGALYNFLCHSEELKTLLYDDSVKIRSAHEFAPLLESLHRHVGANDGPLTNKKLKSLEGVFHLYRKAWTSPDVETYVRCVLKFEFVGDALFYSEEQKFHDSVADLPVDEVDSGVVLPFSMNVVLLGKGTEKDVLKFFSIHDFSAFPDGHQKVHWFAGNFIAVYGKGPHPGFTAYAKRVSPEDASPKFYAPDELDPSIVKRLRG